MQLNQWWIISLFSLKVLAGIAYGLFYLQTPYFATSDTWNYFELSKGETDWLLHDPAAFFKDLFSYGYQHSGNLFLGGNSYWNDLKTNIIIKLLAICNVFTFKNYFANIIIFNFIFFFGPAALYITACDLFRAKKLLTIACVFLIPSFLFWCSGIHKDGLIFLCASMIIYHFHKQLKSKKVSIRSVLISLFYFIIFFALRNFMALLMLPALLAWFLCNRYPQRAKLIVTGIYAAGIFMFFLSAHLNSGGDMPQYIIDKQTEFKKLTGNSQIDVPPLENSFSSFVKFFPVAVDIAFFRPHVTEMQNKSTIPAAFETVALWLLLLIALIFSSKNPSTASQKAFLYFCVCFALSFLLLAGYTNTFSGSIVRYRAVVLPFAVMPLISLLKDNKLSKTGNNILNE